MLFRDKNGKDINIGDHVAWMYGYYADKKVRRVGRVTKLKAMRSKKLGKDVFRVVLHLHFTFDKEATSSRYIAIEGPECKREWGEQLYYPTFVGSSAPPRPIPRKTCNKPEGHEGDCGYREMERYTYSYRSSETHNPSFASYDGNFKTIEVVDEPLTTLETAKRIAKEY